jgi:SPP1 gp7 family putative phage head morphogenesis protein
MSLIVPDDLARTARERERAIQAAEEQLADAVGEATKQLLARMTKASRESLTASSPPLPRMASQMYTYGQVAGWWEQELDTHVVQAVQRVWQAGRASASDADMTVGTFDSVGEYVSMVRDRLSTTATPAIPEEAFNIARNALVDEMSRGSSGSEIAQRLAAELRWQGEDVGFWRRRASETEGAIEQVLDQAGPKYVTEGGVRRENPVRKAMRLNDPEVRQLQQQLSNATQHLDRDRSVWQTRAERIARTETTAAYNAGSQNAFFEEGAGAKMWIALADERTRETHLEAHGQCVPTDDVFTVGGEQLLFPGDPSASGFEVINCRCTIVAGDSCEQLGALAERAGGPIERERERRGEAEPDRDPVALEQSADDVEGATAVVSLTDEQMERARELQGLDLAFDDASEIINDLPDGAEFRLDGLTAHTEVGPCTCVVSDGRLYVFEDASVSPNADFTLDQLKSTAIAETEAAFPGGSDSNVKSFVWHAGRADNEEQLGFAVGGEASQRGVSIYRVDEHTRLDSAVGAGVIRHEVGHALASEAHDKTALEAAQLQSRRRDAFEEVDRSKPEWMRQAAEENPMLEVILSDPQMSADELLNFAPADQRDSLRAQTQQFTTLRDDRVGQAEERLRTMSRHTGVPFETWEEQARVLDGNADAIRGGSSSIPGQVFQDAARADADRIAAMTQEERSYLQRMTGMDRRISSSGYESFSGGESRPAVTNYAASAPNGVEDFSETWRLYVEDKSRGSIATGPDGRAIGFADLFPERDRAITEWAEVMGFDLSTVGGR